MSRDPILSGRVNLFSMQAFYIGVAKVFSLHVEGATRGYGRTASALHLRGLAQYWETIEGCLQIIRGGCDVDGARAVDAHVATRAKVRSTGPSGEEKAGYSHIRSLRDCRIDRARSRALARRDFAGCRATGYCGGEKAGDDELEHIRLLAAVM